MVSGCETTVNFRMVKIPWRRNPVEDGIGCRKEMVLNAAFHFYCSMACLRNSKDIALYPNLDYASKFVIRHLRSILFKSKICFNDFIPNNIGGHTELYSQYLWYLLSPVDTKHKFTLNRTSLNGVLFLPSCLGDLLCGSRQLIENLKIQFGFLWIMHQIRWG